jgi:hypothetical protein
MPGVYPSPARCAERGPFERRKHLERERRWQGVRARILEWASIEWTTTEPSAMKNPMPGVYPSQAPYADVGNDECKSHISEEERYTCFAITSYTFLKPFRC